MRRLPQPSSPTRTSAHSVGWITSLILHGTVVCGAFLFAQQIKLAPQPTPFQWDVVMTTPSPIQPPPSTRPSTGRTQAPASPTPAATQPVSHAPAAEPAVRQASTPPQPIPERIAPSVSEQAPQAKAIEPVTEHALDPLPSSHHGLVQSGPSTPPPAVSSPSQQALSTPTDLQPPAPSETPPAPKESPLRQQAEAPPDSQIASLNPAGQPKPSKADYGWLADLMAKWSEDLDRHYPTMLRTEGVQGKVTVSALLHDDGVLSDVRVAKSSGNALLDQVAVEAVKNGPSVKLSRPLERPSIRVKIPMDYVLSDAR